MNSYYGLIKIPSNKLAAAFIYAVEAEKENELYQAWVQIYPEMKDPDTFMSFKEFKQKHLTSHTPKEEKDSEEIAEELRAVVKSYEELKHGRQEPV